jgi:uncharacterized protein YbaP (TraB family)
MFSALMQRIMKGLPTSTVLVYLDDILIMGKNPTDLLKKMDEVFAQQIFGFTRRNATGQ